MKNSILGPIGIHKPQRYPMTSPNRKGELKDEEYLSPINFNIPGKRMTQKVPELDAAGNIKMNARGKPEMIDIGKVEPGFSLGIIGANIGTKTGREQQALRISDTYTPFVSDIMRAQGIDKAAEFISLTPKILKYTAGGIVASNIASVALPGLGAPLVAPIMVGSSLYRSTMQIRTDYEKFVNGDKANDNLRSRMILAGTNVVMAPFDITSAVTSNVIAFALNSLAGQTIINQIPDALASLDKNLEGLKPIDDGMTNNVLNAVDKFSNILTFNQPAAQLKKVA